jgi:hypothetical protein
MPDDFQYGAPDYLDAIQRQLWPSVKNTANQFSADQDQQLADLQQTAPIQGGLMAPQQPQQQQDQGFLGGLGSLFSNIRNSPITQGIGNTLSQAGNAFFSPGGQALIGGLGTMAMVPKGYPRMNAAMQGLMGASHYGMQAQQQQAQQQEAAARTNIYQQQVGLKQQEAQQTENAIRSLPPELQNYARLGLLNKNENLLPFLMAHPNDLPTAMNEYAQFIKSQKPIAEKYDLKQDDSGNWWALDKTDPTKPPVPYQGPTGQFKGARVEKSLSEMQLVDIMNNDPDPARRQWAKSIHDQIQRDRIAAQWAGPSAVHGETNIEDRRGRELQTNINNYMTAIQRYENSMEYQTADDAKKPQLLARKKLELGRAHNLTVDPTTGKPFAQTRAPAQSSGAKPTEQSVADKFGL